MKSIESFRHFLGLTKREFIILIIARIMFLICVNMGLPFICWTLRDPHCNYSMNK